MPENGILIVRNYSIQNRESEIRERIRFYIENSKSKNTRRAYETDWQRFNLWCSANNRAPLPASEDTICLYIGYLVDRGYKLSTIQRRLSSISIAHQAKKLYSPMKSLEVKNTLKGMQNVHGVKPSKKKAIYTDELKSMVDTLPPTLSGLRDRALLLVGFAGAFRRSELVGLNIEDVEFRREGLSITIQRSKTDQEGKSEAVGIPFGTNLDTCPVRTLQEWLEKSQIETDALFRKVNKGGKVENRRLTDRAVALIVKRTAEAAGLDPSKYAGHSLRSGFASSAAMNGADERSIAKQTRHKSLTVLRGYIQEGTLFANNAATKLGL